MVSRTLLVTPKPLKIGTDQLTPIALLLLVPEAVWLVCGPLAVRFRVGMWLARLRAISRLAISTFRPAATTE
jgi:hypothetical protein